MLYPLMNRRSTLIAAALLYLCVTVPLARLVDRVGLGIGGQTR